MLSQGADMLHPESGGSGDAAPTTGGMEAVFLANRGALLRFFIASGTREEAEDLLHELWLRVTSASFPPVADPMAYLYAMANNMMLMRHRSDERRRRREQDWSTAWAPDQPGSSVTSGERVLLAREQVRAVEQLLSGLGRKTETIFRRFRVDGVVQHQIAREMGITVSAVEKHLQKAYRALLSLRDQIDAE